MIITQKFNSVDEIDPEFIPSLEELLCEQVPHFDIIRKYEKSRNDETRFNYYLFFGNQTNAPIGFAQIEVEKNREHKESFIERIKNRKSILKSDQNENHVRWFIPGSSNEGVVFNPKYIRHAAGKATEIFEEFIERKDVHTQELHFSTAYSDLAKSLEESYTERRSESTFDCLIKNKSNYAEYLEFLPATSSKTIKEAWRYAQKTLQYKMGEYSDFREIFEYKSKGSLQYKGLKNHPKIGLYNSDPEKTIYATFEDSNEVHSIVIYVKGVAGHAFFAIFRINDEVQELLLYQQAIMQFFEDDSASKLHFLGIPETPTLLEELGFTTKGQIFLKMKKPVY